MQVLVQLDGRMRTMECANALEKILAPCSSYADLFATAFCSLSMFIRGSAETAAG